LVRSGYAALNDRNPAGVLALLAPGAEFKFCPPAGRAEVLRGASALKEFYDSLYRVFDLVNLDCREVSAEGDHVHVHGTVTLRVAESGQSTLASFRHTYRVRDGAVQAAVFEDPVNPLELMRDAGR
jgi:ketosteroid isomerase-like protein